MIKEIKSTPSPPPFFWKDIFSVLFFAVLYLGAHYLAFLFPDTEQILMAVWPAGGIGIAALLLNPRRLCF